MCERLRPKALLYIAWMPSCLPAPPLPASRGLQGTDQALGGTVKAPRGGASKNLQSVSVQKQDSLFAVVPR